MDAQELLNEAEKHSIPRRLSTTGPTNIPSNRKHITIMSLTYTFFFFLRNLSLIYTNATIIGVSRQSQCITNFDCQFLRLTLVWERILSHKHPKRRCHNHTIAPPQVNRESKNASKPKTMPKFWTELAEDVILIGAGAGISETECMGAIWKAKGLPDEPSSLTTLMWSFWPTSQCFPMPQ